MNFDNSQEFRELSAFYSQSSLFSALGVSRHENTHSNFIAWLLAPKPEKNDHGLGDTPLRKLLQTIAHVCRSLPHSFGKLPPNVSNAIISGGYTLSDISVEREKHIGVGRLDVYVEGNIAFDGTILPLRLAIENKIKSSEHDGQTGRYQASLSRSVSRPGIYLGVYLTPLANREYESLGAPQCDAQEFIQLNYQYLADYVIAPCRDTAGEGNVRRYLDEYLLALGLPELRQEKGDVIMAVSKEERDLLSRFWEKHKDLLIAAMLSTADSDALDDAEHEMVKKASEALISASRRDNTRYTWDFRGGGGQNLGKRKLALEVVSHFADEHPHITLAELQEAFPDSLQGGKLKAVEELHAANAKNFGSHERYFTKSAIKVADCHAAVSNQWKADNIDAFIKHAENLGYTISSTG